jgi:chromatin remodeling complex protein RSC6
MAATTCAYCTGALAGRETHTRDCGHAFHAKCLCEKALEGGPCVSCAPPAARAPGTPSYWAKPVHMSAQLAAFLGVAADATLSHRDITRRVLDYARERNLIEHAVITVDDALRALLTPERDEVPILRLQSLIRRHMAAAVA